mmetsp:Transcript_7965/g.24460  ORF Transcript_7965/g.24460 Transcript_7965/m.24460 type:complete len:239 (+) Transcript_7965:426-1142(+)
MRPLSSVARASFSTRMRAPTSGGSVAGGAARLAVAAPAALERRSSESCRSLEAPLLGSSSRAADKLPTSSSRAAEPPSPATEVARRALRPPNVSAAEPTALTPGAPPAPPDSPPGTKGMRTRRSSGRLVRGGRWLVKGLLKFLVKAKGLLGWKCAAVTTAAAVKAMAAPGCTALLRTAAVPGATVAGAWEVPPGDEPTNATAAGGSVSVSPASRRCCGSAATRVLPSAGSRKSAARTP